MTGERYIYADWGTSHLRATLCEYIANKSVIKGVRNGPGVKDATRSIEETLFTAIQPWIDEHGALPIFLAGMVGSNIGWRETPYLSCPLPVNEIAGNGTAFEARGHDIVIAPGLECMNALGARDLMRGEEVQLLGSLNADPSLQLGEQMVCLPGTHTKWALLRDGIIISFQTAITGELYSLLLQHSVLLAVDDDSTDSGEFNSAAFGEGVAMAESAQAAISHTLFSVRSRLLQELIGQDAAASYLSGMLIGADVLGALNLLSRPEHAVTIVGDRDLSDKFAIALQYFGADSQTIESRSASLQGFTALYEEYHRHDGQHRVSA